MDKGKGRRFDGRLPFLGLLIYWNLIINIRKS
jgi:hypothetical protein